MAEMNLCSIGRSTNGLIVWLASNRLTGQVLKKRVVALDLIDGFHWLDILGPLKGSEKLPWRGLYWILQTPLTCLIDYDRLIEVMSMVDASFSIDRICTIKREIAAVHTELFGVAWLDHLSTICSIERHSPDFYRRFCL